jgi:glycosyltransferase involved in cell wall biosynthesis
MKVTSIMCTYGRFRCVERSISLFLDQDYEDKELVIFNTADTDLVLSDELSKYDIKIVNNQYNLIDGKPYSSIGQIRRDSLTFANGDLYICWDDDDLYMPFHISQSVNGIKKTGKTAWKPKKSYFSKNGGLNFELAENFMEASIIVDLKYLKNKGFNDETGSEHLKWYNDLTSRDELFIEDVNPFESYCFNWGDWFAPHKQSGDIKNPNNFENHKKNSIDFGQGRKLKRVSNAYIYKNICDYRNNQELYERTTAIIKF